MTMAAPVVAVELDPSAIQVLAGDAFEHAYRQEFDSAREDLTAAIGEFPDNPAGYLFLGLLYQLWMFDVGSDSMELSFDSCMDVAEEKAGAVLAEETNARAHLYLGAVYTCRAMYCGWKGSYWDTYHWGMRAPNEMSKALALDSSLTDACFDLGVSEYFNYAAGRYLTGLSVFGSYARSVELLRRAVGADGYFSLTAGYTLAWIWSHEKMFAEAESVLVSLLVRYPGNRLFRKLLRDAYYMQQDYASSITVGTDLGRELAEQQPDNIQARTENWMALAQDFYYSRNPEGARACCDSVIACEPKQDYVIGLAKFVRTAKALRRKT